MRRIAIVTGSRAEYGLLYWIIKEIHEDPELELQLVVTGTHLSEKFGMTVNIIEGDGFPIAGRVEMPLFDSEEGIAESMGVGLIGCAKIYRKLQPDLLVVLGDRFEIHAAVSASAPFRIPVAHIHGGESSEGAIDEVFRHAITKMSHIHFPATEKYARRIIQMGENPNRVFCFGAPGLDSIRRLSLFNRQELEKELGIPSQKRIGSITYHPVTINNEDTAKEIDALFNVITEISEEHNLFWIITEPNADPGNSVIRARINDFVERNPGIAKAYTSLGQLRYLSLLKNADVMVGNSSSGLIEAPSFKLPVVNIGARQEGRIKAKNIIDAPVGDRISILKALSENFRSRLKSMKSPYGDGKASEKIVGILKTINIDATFIKKRFHDCCPSPRHVSLIESTR